MLRNLTLGSRAAVEPVGQLHINVTQTDALAHFRAARVVFIAHLDRFQIPSLVESSGTVVHDGGQVVGDVLGDHDGVAHQAKIVLSIVFDVVPQDADVLVSVRSLVFVPHADGVSDLVNHDASVLAPVAER